MSRDAYKIDRTKFIDWIDKEQLNAAMEDLRIDLKMGGEFVLTATELLHRCLEVPVHLLENYTGFNEFEPGDELELIYKQPFE